MKRSRWERSSQNVAIDTHSVKKTTNYDKFINLNKLDFYLLPVCHITTSTLNVYCCLKCGTYLQGYHENSPLFQHSLNNKYHELFINLNNGNIIQLPSQKLLLTNNFIPLNKTNNHNNKDTDELDAKLLNLIKEPILSKLSYCINPIYTRNFIKNFPINSNDILNDKSFLNGFITINSNKSSHWSVLLLILSHISPLREFFLLTDSNCNTNVNLISVDSTIKNLFQQISLTLKRIWSIILVRDHISIDSLLNCLLNNFTSIFNNLKDPRDLLLWLFNRIFTIDANLFTILKNNLQGKLLVKNNNKVIPFWQLTLKLPEMTVFKDGRNINDNLQQIELLNLINDNNFNIKQYPKYLILNFKRFSNSSDEKFPIRNRNQTIVQFDSVMELDKFKYRLIINLINDANTTILNQSSNTQNDTIDNILKDDENNWKCQLLTNPEDNSWVEINNTEIINRDIEFLFLKETYLQVWERIDDY